MGADYFAVSNIEEAMQIREAQVVKPILILGYTPVDEVDILGKLNISQTIVSLEHARRLSEEAYKNDVVVNVHIKLDTGMSRIGLLCHNKELCDKAVEEIEEISKLKNLKIEGVFTHFAVSDEGESGKERTRKQYDNFMYVVEKAKNKGVSIPLKHCSNSGAIIDYKDMNMDMVRAGIILYGLLPSNELRRKIMFKSAMQLKTVISRVKTVSSGAEVSYGGTFVTQRETKIATVPIGYADGYLRSFSGKAYMLVRGKKAYVLGRVCMDQLMLDVTDIDRVAEGDIVTVFGKDGEEEITVDTLAAIADTINYELVCLVGKRVPRIYLRSGDIVGSLNYICNK